MTLDEFSKLVGALSPSMEVSRYFSLVAEFPRMVWMEVEISQEYGSDNACVEHTTVAVDYMTMTEDDPNVQAIKDLFRGAKMPFTCRVQRDEDDRYTSFLFNLWLEEDV